MVKCENDRDRTLRKQNKARYLRTSGLRRNIASTKLTNLQLFRINCHKWSCMIEKLKVNWKSAQTVKYLVYTRSHAIHSCTRLVIGWQVARKENHTIQLYLLFSLCLKLADTPLFTLFQKVRQGITKKNCLVHLQLN